MSSRSSNSSSYKYGFNGQESDDEIKGEGNSLSFKFRVYDPRIGKFLSVDPLAQQFSWNSTYAFAENDVIRAKDLEGNEKFIVNVVQNMEGGQTSTTIELPTAGMLGEGIQINLTGIHGQVIKSTYTDPIDVYSDGNVGGGETKDITHLVKVAANNSINPSESEGEVYQYTPNFAGIIKDELYKPSYSPIDATGKFVGRLFYNIADDMAIFTTSYALTQDVFGLDGPLNLEGSLITSNEKRVNAGLNSMITLMPTNFLTVGKTLNGGQFLKEFAGQPVLKGGLRNGVGERIIQYNNQIKSTAKAINQGKGTLNAASKGKQLVNENESE